MKVLISLVLALLVTTYAYAVDITVTLTQEQYDAMSVLTVTPEQWAQNAVSNKADKMIDRLVEKYSDKQPGKVSKQDKKNILKTIDLVKEKKDRNGGR